MDNELLSGMMRAGRQRLPRKRGRRLTKKKCSWSSLLNEFMTFTLAYTQELVETTN